MERIASGFDRLRPFSRFDTPEAIGPLPQIAEIHVVMQMALSANRENVLFFRYHFELFCRLAVFLIGAFDVDEIEQALQRTLVVRCQLGEHRAMEEFFLRHHRALGYYRRRLLGREEIEDLQQEVWLTVLRRIGQLRSPDAFVVWLYQIARNKIVAIKSAASSQFS